MRISLHTMPAHRPRHLERGPTSHAARQPIEREANQNQQQASLRAYGPHPKSGTRAMALPSVCPHQPSDATATSGCGSTCVHVCIAPVSDPVDDDVVLADQNARAACHYLGQSLATPSHPRRRPLPLPAMPTGAASCFASPDDLRSGLGWLFATHYSAVASAASGSAAPPIGASSSYEGRSSRRSSRSSSSS